MRNHYYWPSLAADVFGWVAACPTCAKNRLMGTQSIASMRLFPATEPFAALAIDLLGPLPRTPEGYEYILVICDRSSKFTRAVPLKDISALDVLSAFLDTWVASYGIPDSVLSDNGPQFAAVLWQGVLKALGIDTNYATPYHPQTNGQVERFNKKLVQQLRHYVSDRVVTWSRYLSLVVTAHNSQLHSSTGQVPFAFVSPRRLTPVAIERLTAGADPGEIVTPGRTKENFLQHLDALIPLVRDTMEKAQARYKRAFDKRVQAPREALRVADWVFVKSHENQGGKLVFKTLGRYQIFKTDGRRLTIESEDGIRTTNGNHVTRAPEQPEGDPAWARALAAWQVPSLPSSGSKPIEAVLDHFAGQGCDEHERLMCDNTPSQPHPVGEKASQAVSPGSLVGEYPPRKKTPKSTHARRRPGEDAPSDKLELCDRKFTCPRRRPRGNTHASPSYPVPSPQTVRKTPPQTPSRDPQKTLRKPPLRHPHRSLRKPSPQGTWGQSQRRAAAASDTALSRGGGRVLRDTLAAPRCQGRGVILVNGPSRVYTKFGP